MWEIIPPKKAICPSKEQSTRGNRIYKQFQKYFSLYALVAPTVRAKQLAWWLCGDLKFLRNLAAEFFPNATTVKG
jgi:hypothetical protein